MGLLLYKSNEMFSSTELIRKSKTIFNKIINKEIEKAIILRDGKPGFLLMDFKKYEEVMAEFEELKELNSKSLNSTKLTKTTEEKLSDLEELITKKKSKKKKNKTKNNKKLDKKAIDIIPKDNDLKKIEKIKIKPKSEKLKIDKKEKESIEVKSTVISIPKEKKHIDSSYIIPPRPKIVKPKMEAIVEEDFNIALEEIEALDTTFSNISQDEIKEEEPELSEEEEIEKALETIQSINFDDNMKAVAEQKIKERIIQARELKAIQKEQDELDNKDALKEELKLQVNIKEINKKKEQELKEFWD